MSIARPIFKGVSLMLTRRVRGRTFLLRPGKWINQIVQYVAAVMANKWNIELHAIVVMSNHWHVVQTDPDGNIVEFQRDCHHFITRGINERYDESEGIWASQASSRVECEDAEDIISKISYTMANPVEAGLVRYGHSWPGVRLSWPRKPQVIKRPGKYFRGPDQGGEWPDQAVLDFSRPPGYEELSDEELAEVISSAVEQREEGFRRERDAGRKGFLGRRRVLGQSRYAHSRGRESKAGISPKVACRDKWRRIERLAANKEWSESYRVSLVQWRGGDRNVEFPAGTYKMRVVHGANCARAPD